MSKISWVYMIIPYFGAALAAGVFYIHNYIANAPAKQNEPMEFMNESRSHQQDEKKQQLLEEDKKEYQQEDQEDY